MTHYLIHFASTSIFYRSFFTSDPFGKGIFLALLALSLISCYILFSKSLNYRLISMQIKAFKKLVEKHEQKILQIPIKKVQLSNPFHSIYKALQTSSLKILKKNQFFCDNDSKNAALSSEDIHQLSACLERVIDEQGIKLCKNLFILSTVVSLAPFLGILGTVWGILMSLSSMENGASSLSNAGVLAGLSTALATTVLGLVIAIPALISYNYLKNYHQRILQEMDLFAHHLVSQLALSYKQVSL